MPRACLRAGFQRRASTLFSPLLRERRQRTRSKRRWRSRWRECERGFQYTRLANRRCDNRRRQHFVSGIDNTSGMCLGTATRGRRPDEAHGDRVHFEVARNAHSPGEFARCQPLAKRCTESVSSVPAHSRSGPRLPSCDDLGERDLRLGSRRAIIRRNAGSRQPHWVARPGLGKKQAQDHCHWHFAAGERQRHHGLAVRRLAQPHIGAQTPTE